MYRMTLAAAVELCKRANEKDLPEIAETIARYWHAAFGKSDGTRDIDVCLGTLDMLDANPVGSSYQPVDGITYPDWTITPLTVDDGTPDTLVDEYTTDRPYQVTAQYPDASYSGTYDRLADAMRDYDAEVAGFVAMLGQPQRTMSALAYVNGSRKAIGVVHAWDTGHAVAYTFA